MKRLVQLLNTAVLAVFGLLFFGSLPAAQADTIVQGYQASGKISPAWLVSLAENSNNTVELTPANQSSRIFGVSVDPSQASVTLQNQTNQQVFVATNGTYPLLVSNQNGPIKAGDYLSISATSGIAAKATNSQTLVIGQATQAFDGNSGVLAVNSGYKIGKVLTKIQPGRNPLLKNDVAIPSVIRSAGDYIAGKDISAIRIYVAFAIFVIALALAFVISLSGIRSAMISIGRNPLSRQSILRAMSSVVLASAMVLVVGAVGVYLLLRL